MSNAQNGDGQEPLLRVAPPACYHQILRKKYDYPKPAVLAAPVSGQPKVAAVNAYRADRTGFRDIGRTDGRGHLPPAAGHR